MHSAREDFMKVAFRVDSGRDLGTGHLSRCITLAHALKDKFNAECFFIMREHQGHHVTLVQRAGFSYVLLPLKITPNYFSGNYNDWVGDNAEQDALLTEKSINRWSETAIDFLIVDHYGLDIKWESYFVDRGFALGIIDDLVNRRHSGAFLIDQTCGRENIEYYDLVPSSMRLFTGESYCILRPEFLFYRPVSLMKRNTESLSLRIMVNFGSTDPHNHTARALVGLKPFMGLYKGKVVVVVGSGCPYIATIKKAISELPYQCDLLIDVEYMAKLMVDVDLAIGAAGATTWERCILGIPTLLLKTAENQSDVIHRVAEKGAARIYFGAPDDPALSTSLVDVLLAQQQISKAASQLVDGKGMDEIISFMSFGAR